MTRKNVVIDTGILSLYFAGDPRVKSLFSDSGKNGFVTSINLSEFYYKTCETLGAEVTKHRYYQCREMVEILETDRELTLSAGIEKCQRRGNLSLADCFAIAATKSLNGTLLTTDSELARIKDVDARFFDADSF